jgi:threonine/homoserine/homoserine lactone efflux protein
VESLAIASAGMLSVGSITIVILLLTSNSGLRNGLAYVVGYVGAYTVIGIALVVAGYDEVNGGSSGGGTVSSVLTMFLGLLLLWLAQRNWRRKPSANQDPPRLFSLLDRVTPVKALAIGAAVTVVNFKNLAIFASAVSVVLLSGLPLSTQLALVVLVVVVFCAAVIAPLLVFVSFPDRANELLLRFKQTLETHGRPIGIWVPIFFGLLFLVRGLKGLQ